MDIERQTVQRDPVTGSQQTVHVQEHVASPASVSAAKANRTDSYIWYVVGVIEILLLLRLAFLLLGANNSGFTSLLYSVTFPLVAMFKGVFPSPGNTGGYLETASVLAMLVFALIGWGIVSLIDISNRNRVA